MYNVIKNFYLSQKCHNNIGDNTVNWILFQLQVIHTLKIMSDSTQLLPLKVNIVIIYLSYLACAWAC